MTDVEMVPDPKPCRTCVCVKELPFKTDVSTSATKRSKAFLKFRFQVEIECIAHQ
jgi:enamine deaminase RidA (YjgF/YER057c/UK114 family)